MNRTVFAGLASGLLSLSTPLFAQEAGPSTLVRAFMQAWGAADARMLGALFADDADLVTPDGIDAKGRGNIEGFYAAAFSRGYAGSVGRGEVVSERTLLPGVSIVDARWSITGARNPDGSARRPEAGILVAVIGWRDSQWRILALRENAGPKDFTAFPPPR